ncbi:MAG: right-handed parallel beta-helix repeat-containing protein [Anaerolineae bacterium]|nr:right-handed parallel beta-helix repeat-containing protein [Anaerolineae bacterium]
MNERSDAGMRADFMGQDPPEEPQNMRPFRTRRQITLTVGQDEGDLRGQDDKVIQAAVDYVYRLGGGTVHVLPGIYTMRNAVYLRPGITLRGSGEDTVLRKAPSVTASLVREADWFEYAVQVSDPAGFAPGGGLMLSTEKTDVWPAMRLYTIVAVEGDLLYLDQRTEKNYWMSDGAKAQTIHPILCAFHVDDVSVEDIVLDGNCGENDYANGNYTGAVFIQYCNRWTFKNVLARRYNGDAFSFQVCDDIHFENCQAVDNAGFGFHPGSGSQRPVFRRCVARGNEIGLFWCWGVCDGIAEGCTFSENRSYGVSLGHRDTDNILRGCVIERNGEVGVLFRQEVNEYRTPDRNRVEECLIRDNGEIGIDVQWKAQDLIIRGCRFERTSPEQQRIAIRIGREVSEITVEGNAFLGGLKAVEDLREGETRDSP